MNAQSALDALIERFTHAWNERDLSAMQAVFVDDADFVNPYGDIWHGRVTIAAEHGRLFRGKHANTTLRFQIAKIRLLSRTAAIVYGIWSMTGHAAGGARYLPVRTGFGVFVAKREAAGWRIICAQITDVPASEP